MNKAFIFDFDGVIVDSEPLWEIENKKLFTELYGEELRAKIGPINGMSMAAIHAKASEHGGEVPFEEFYNAVMDHAPAVYQNAKVTPGIEAFITELKQQGFQLGIVSTSRLPWLEIVFKRLGWTAEDFGTIISLQDRDDLNHKPEPDGYIQAMKDLNSSPETTIILEDSNPGIQAAKTSGAYVIGFKQNLIPGYKQSGADLYAENIKAVLSIVAKLLL